VTVSCPDVDVCGAALREATTTARAARAMRFLISYPLRRNQLHEMLTVSVVEYVPGERNVEWTAVHVTEADPLWYPFEMLAFGCPTQLKLAAVGGPIVLEIVAPALHRVCQDTVEVPQVTVCPILLASRMQF
jgi:hypothetical protein